MNLLDHLNSLPVAEQQALAQACNTSVGYLRKALSIGQKLSPELCVAIERHTDSAVTRPELRADWRSIWPELAAAEDRRVVQNRRRAERRASGDL